MPTLFFYGTLSIPEILKRVLGREIDNLSFEPAVVKGHAVLFVQGQGALSPLHEKEST